MKFRWTIYRKIQIMILIVLLVVYGIFEGVLVQLIRGNVRDDFNSNVMDTSILLQKNSEVMFKDARKSIEFLINQHEGKPRDDKYIEDYLLVLKESKDYISNTFIAYNDGTYVLVPKADLPIGFDPRERAWYKQRMSPEKSSGVNHISILSQRN